METIQELIEVWISRSKAEDFGAGIGLVHLSAVLPQGSPHYALIRDWAATSPADRLARHLAVILPFDPGTGWDEEASELQGDETLRALIAINEWVGLAVWRRDRRWDNLSGNGIESYVNRIQMICVDSRREPLEAAAEAGSLEAVMSWFNELIGWSCYKGELNEAVGVLWTHQESISFEKLMELLREVTELDSQMCTDAWLSAVELAIKLVGNTGYDTPQWVKDEISWACSGEPWMLAAVEEMVKTPGAPSDVVEIVNAARQDLEMEEEDEPDLSWSAEDWGSYHRLVRESEGDFDAKFRLATGLIFGDFPGGDPHRGLELLSSSALSGHREAVATVQEICTAGLVGYLSDLWHNGSVAGAAYALGYLHCFWKPQSTPLDSFGRALGKENDEEQYWDEREGAMYLEKASMAGHRKATELLAQVD